eukprot:1183676-Prorocentrum_minimum.AAC.1
MALSGVDPGAPAVPHAESGREYARLFASQGARGKRYLSNSFKSEALVVGIYGHVANQKRSSLEYTVLGRAPAHGLCDHAAMLAGQDGWQAGYVSEGRRYDHQHAELERLPRSRTRPHQA